MNKQYKIKLVDDNGKYFEVSFGYDDYNKPEHTHFGVSTQNGQDEFKPATDNQQTLLDYWHKYHLKHKVDISSELTEDMLDELFDNLQFEYSQRTSITSLDEGNEEDLKLIYQALENFDDDDKFKVWALAKHCDCTLEEMSNIEVERNCNYTCQGRDYLVCTDNEADELEKERVESTIEECYLSEMKYSHNGYNFSKREVNQVWQYIEPYIDIDRWVNDWCGNRGENLSNYDGCEYEELVNDTWYFIYKQ